MRMGLTLLVGQPDHQQLAAAKMKRRFYTIVALLIGGHLITELHTVLFWVNPQLEFYFVDHWFLKPDYKVDNMNVLWYSKMIEDLLLLCSLFFAGASQAFSRNYSSYLEWQRYSFRLYGIWCVYFFYHVFDMWMFFYNYKTSYVLYIIVLLLSTALAMFIAIFRHKKDL